MLKNLDTNPDDIDEDGEDEDLLPELDYEKDDPDRDFGIIEGDDEYDEDDALTEVEDADESDDPSQYDRYMDAEQGKANGKVLTICSRFQSKHVPKNDGVQAKESCSAQPPSKVGVQIHDQVQVEIQHTQKRPQYLQL